VIPQAIDNAKENAVNNHIENATFYVGKAEEVLPDFYEGKHIDTEDIVKDSKDKAEKADASGSSDNTTSIEERKKALHPDVIVVDPPRKGCDINCLDTMLKMKPERIVYVSCDSATLARDLRILVDGGYKLTRARTCDLFPNTVHIESVCQLICE
jgi:23S rRNA (uracil1939-C5)-methyltransferase